MSKIEIKPKAGETFYEKVKRFYIGADGYQINRSEMVSVPMIYNDFGIKIRKQCSTCQRYKRFVPQRITPVLCDIAQVFSTSQKMNIPYGRGLCDKWKMSDLYAKVGSMDCGRVKSPNYIKWLIQNYNDLLNTYNSFPPGCHLSWDAWHINQYETITGCDVYGNKLKNK